MAETVFSTDIPDLQPFIRGKVRDVYDLGERLLVVTTDRISAFDSVLPTSIPDKGRVLNQLSVYWFERFRDLCPNHFVAADPEAIRAALAARGVDAPAAVLDGRAMLGRKTQAILIEAVVRGYLDGSGWKEYQASGSVCGIKLPPGLQQGSRLPEPIFTPAVKATSGHDQNVTHEEMLRHGDPEQLWEVVRLSLAVYTSAAAYAEARGILIADTKFEFGVLDGQVVMIDECLTPDSSRFWDAERYRPGGPQPSFDKQSVRDYLDASGWNHEPPAPPLPPDVVERTSASYREIYRRLTGARLGEE